MVLLLRATTQKMAPPITTARTNQRALVSHERPRSLPRFCTEPFSLRCLLGHLLTVRAVWRTVNARHSDLVRRHEIMGLRPADAERRLLQRHNRIRINAMRQPDVGANDGVMADDAVASQNRGVGIND